MSEETLKLARQFHKQPQSFNDIGMDISETKVIVLLAVFAEQVASDCAAIVDDYFANEPCTEADDLSAAIRAKFEIPAHEDKQ